MSKKPTVLMILDGYGLNDRTDGNAVAQAKTPVMDQLMKEYPFVKGNASGLAVGLPDGQMGNSEVGHMNMGAGRIVYQELTRITKEINDGDFFKNQALLDGMENVKKNNSDLHLYGLLSDGGVHSHITHVYGLLELAKREGIKNVYVHCFLDGRDTAPTSGKGFIEALEAKMAELGVGKIASISGRYYAMDRDNRWDRVEKAYNVLTKGEGEQAESAVAAMDASYAKDEFRLDEDMVSDILKTYLSKYDHNDDNSAWFNKLKEIADEHGFASDMKAYKADPESFKGNVSDIAEVVRIAVTGRANTPDLWTIVHIMGEEQMKERIEKYIK